jgi:hypothetical protein
MYKTHIYLDEDSVTYFGFFKSGVTRWSQHCGFFSCLSCCHQCNRDIQVDARFVAISKTSQLHLRTAVLSRKNCFLNQFSANPRSVTPSSGDYSPSSRTSSIWRTPTYHSGRNNLKNAKLIGHHHSR